MDAHHSPPTFSPKTRSYSRSSENWVSPNVGATGSPRSPLQLQPKSPLSAAAPWGNVLGNDPSMNINSPQEAADLRRRSSFTGGVDARPQSPCVENGDLPEEQVFVTHVESPVLFWAQTAEHETAQVIQKMSADLQIYCRNKPLLQSTPHIDKVYGGVYPEDKEWYRCRVRELIGDDQVRVHFVDYGNTAVISLRSIVFLSHEILSLVPFAQLYCLDGVNTASSELNVQGVESLNILTADKVLTVKLKEAKKALDVPCSVELRDDSEGGVGNITQEMIKQGLLTTTQQVVNYDSRHSPPPLSPRNTSLSEAMSKEMDKLCKENESLRSVIKLYKEGEKTAEEMRKYYSLQTSKHQEQLDQAVSHKCMELISKVNDLHEMRDNTASVGTSPDVISEAINLTRKEKVDLESLASLQKVKETETKLQSAQDQVCGCSNKDMMADFILLRDDTRQELYDCIELLCWEVEQMPLKEREESLQLSLSQLQEKLTVAEVSSSTGPVPEEAIQAYEEWQEKSRVDAVEVRTKVNRCSDELVSGLGLLQKALKPSKSGDLAKPVSFGDFDQLIEALSSAIEEEMNKQKILLHQASEEKDGNHIASQVMIALVNQLEKEIGDIKELRDRLVKKYKDIQADMGQWLEAKPDVKKITEKRKTIKGLRSRLRHRLADKKDLEEGDDPESAKELQQVEEDILEIYLQLHKSFEDEHLLLADLASSTPVHFPELPLVHPELGLTEFLESNGLVKLGRQVEHYPNHDSAPFVSYDKCSIIKTEFAGSPCILKEYILDRDFGDRETLQSKAVKFSRLDNRFLVPLQAFFVKGNKAFIQMPLLMSAEEWISSYQASSQEVTVVLRDVLEALRALHSIDTCHGCLHLQSVLVEKVDDDDECQYRGRLDFAPFSNPKCSKSGDMKSLGDLTAKMNFANMDSTLSFAQLTEDDDLLAVLGDLLDTDDESRLTAQQTLLQPYFCKSQVPPLSGPEVLRVAHEASEVQRSS